MSYDYIFIVTSVMLVLLILNFVYWVTNFTYNTIIDIINK